MSQLIVRNLDPAVVAALQRRAAANGRSAEAEHREILRTVLMPESAGGTLKQLLLEMPDVGGDDDFARARDVGREVEI